jgi:hypothetical protein
MQTDISENLLDTEDGHLEIDFTQFEVGSPFLRYLTHTFGAYVVI